MVAGDACHFSYTTISQKTDSHITVIHLFGAYQTQVLKLFTLFFIRIVFCKNARMKNVQSKNKEFAKNITEAEERRRTIVLRNTAESWK